MPKRLASYTKEWTSEPTIEPVRFGDLTANTMTQVQFFKRVGKPVMWLACLAPLSILIFDAFTDGLSANPIEDITHRTGTTALILLLVTLSVSPIKKWTRMGGLITFRRPLGLFAFFYACLHFLTYLVIDQFFAWRFIVEDVMDRPYITVGFTAFVLMGPLALTSTKGWIKRMGGKRWNALHKLIYLSAAGGVFHYLWLVKADTRKPIVFGLILVVLLATRLQRRSKPKPRTRPSSVPSPAEAVAGSE